MSIDFEEWKKGNKAKWKIMDEVFPKIEELLQGGRVVQFSIEDNHPVMRTFASKDFGNDNVIRQSVALIKSRFTRWGGSVVLPADSVIEDCVKEIVSLSGYNAPVDSI